MSRNNNDIVRFSGQVELDRNGQKIRADELIIDNLSEQLQASGRVIFEDANYRLQTDTLTLDQKTDSALFRSAEFELSGQHASGSAVEIVKIDASRSRFQDILYSTCGPTTAVLIDI